VGRSGQANTIAGDPRLFFLHPFNSVASDITKGLKVLSAGGIIRKEIHLRSAGQVSGPFFEA
jgi:hypothetical protein